MLTPENLMKNRREIVIDAVPTAGTWQRVKPGTSWDRAGGGR